MLLNSLEFLVLQNYPKIFNFTRLSYTSRLFLKKIEPKFFNLPNYPNNFQFEKINL